MKLVRIGKFSELNLNDDQHAMIIEGDDDEIRDCAKHLYKCCSMIGKNISCDQAFNEIKNEAYSSGLTLENSQKLAETLTRKLGFWEK